MAFGDSDGTFIGYTWFMARVVLLALSASLCAAVAAPAIISLVRPYV